MYDDRTLASNGNDGDDRGVKRARVEPSSDGRKRLLVNNLDFYLSPDDVDRELRLMCPGANILEVFCPPPQNQMNFRNKNCGICIVYVAADDEASIRALTNASFNVLSGRKISISDFHVSDQTVCVRDPSSSKSESQIVELFPPGHIVGKPRRAFSALNGQDAIIWFIDLRDCEAMIQALSGHYADGLSVKLASRRYKNEGGGGDAGLGNGLRDSDRFHDGAGRQGDRDARDRSQEDDFGGSRRGNLDPSQHVADLEADLLKPATVAAVDAAMTFYNSSVALNLDRAFIVTKLPFFMGPTAALRDHSEAVVKAIESVDRSLVVDDIFFLGRKNSSAIVLFRDNLSPDYFRGIAHGQTHFGGHVLDLIPFTPTVCFIAKGMAVDDVRFVASFCGAKYVDTPELGSGDDMFAVFNDNRAVCTLLALDGFSIAHHMMNFRCVFYRLQPWMNHHVDGSTREGEGRDGRQPPPVARDASEAPPQQREATYGAHGNEVVSRQDDFHLADRGRDQRDWDERRGLDHRDRSHDVSGIERNGGVGGDGDYLNMRVEPVQHPLPTHDLDRRHSWPGPVRTEVETGDPRGDDDRDSARHRPVGTVRTQTEEDGLVNMSLLQRGTVSLGKKSKWRVVLKGADGMRLVPDGTGSFVVEGEGLFDYIISTQQ
jgi:hypothetical protein